MKWKHWALMPHFLSLIFPSSGLSCPSKSPPIPFTLSYPRPPHICEICFAPNPPGPGSPSSQFTGVAWFYSAPWLSGIRSSSSSPPQSPTLTATSTPEQPSHSSPHTAGHQTPLEKEQDRLSKPTGPQTGCPLQDNRLFSLFLIFCAQVFPHSGMLGEPATPL